MCHRERANDLWPEKRPHSVSHSSTQNYIKYNFLQRYNCLKGITNAMQVQIAPLCFDSSVPCMCFFVIYFFTRHVFLKTLSFSQANYLAYIKVTIQAVLLYISSFRSPRRASIVGYGGFDRRDCRCFDCPDRRTKRKKIEFYCLPSVRNVQSTANGGCLCYLLCGCVSCCFSLSVAVW